MSSVYDEPFAVRLPENPYAAALGAASPLWSLYAGAVTAGLGLWGLARAASFGLAAERGVAEPEAATPAEPAVDALVPEEASDGAPSGDYWTVNPVEQGPGDPFAFDQAPESVEAVAPADAQVAADPAPASGKRKRRKAAAEG